MELSPACIVVYLALYEVWRQLILVGNSYSFVFSRLVFLVGLAAVLWRRNDLQSLFGHLLGRIRLGWRGAWIATAMVILTVAGRMVLDCLWPYTTLHLSPRAFVEDMLVAPINEEMVFRGVFLGVLLRQPGWNKLAAVIVASLVFVGTHEVAHAIAFIRLMSAGLVMGLAYVETRSVPVCILCHMIWNLAAYCPFIHPANPGEI